MDAGCSSLFFSRLFKLFRYSADKPHVAAAVTLTHREIVQVVLSFIVYWQTITEILVLFLSQRCKSENMTNKFSQVDNTLERFFIIYAINPLKR